MEVKKYQAKYLSVIEANSHIFAKPLDQINLRIACDGTLLEDATIRVTLSDGGHIFEIKGTQIMAVYNFNSKIEDIKNKGWIYSEDDIRSKKSLKWFKIVKTEYLKTGFYQKEEGRDYVLETNLPWAIKSSNGSVLSSGATV